MKKSFVASLALVASLSLLIGALIGFNLFAESEGTDNGQASIQEGADSEEIKNAVEMKLSAEGLDLIKNFEGYAQYPYSDYSHYSIGYGSYVCGLDEDPYEIYPNGISIMEAEELLRGTVGKYVSAVNKFALEYNVVLNQNQFDALCSFTYNIGANVWKRDPSDFRVKALLIGGDYTQEEIKEALYMWRYAGGKENSGLAKRRLREAALFNSDINMSDPAQNGYDVKYYITNATYVKVGSEPTKDSTSLGSVRRNNVIPVLYTDESGEYGFTNYAAYFGWVKMSQLIGIDEKGSVSVLDESCIDSQGIYYTLDHVEMKACIGDSSESVNNSKYPGINNGYVYLTKYIVFDGRVYILNGIGNKAFYACNQIKKIYIPDSVESIAENAFDESTLTDIYYDGGSYSEEYAKSSDFNATNYKCISSHTFGEWETVVEGDHKYARTQERQCSVCKDKETRAVVSLSVSAPPDKTEYYEGDILDPTGIKVAAFYSDGESFDVTNDVSYEGFDSTVMGNSLVKVKYSVFEANFTVRVNKKILTGVAVLKTPTKTSYVEGTQTDYTGLTVVALYNNGTNEQISEYKLSECDINTVGKQIITVTYNGFEAKFTVEIKAKSLTSVSLISTPYKKEYYCGEEFDPAGIEMKASYDNGTSEIVTEGFKVTRFDSSVPGSIKIRIYYGTLYKSIYVNIINNRFISEHYGIDGAESLVIDPGLTVKEFLSRFEDSDRIKLVSASGKELSEALLVGSGCTAELWYNADKLATLNITVSGDLNGDGLLSYADYLMMSVHFTKGYGESFDKVAHDVNKDGEVTLADLVCLLSEIKTKNEDEQS